MTVQGVLSDTISSLAPSTRVSPIAPIPSMAFHAIASTATTSQRTKPLAHHRRQHGSFRHSGPGYLQLPSRAEALDTWLSQGHREPVLWAMYVLAWRRLITTDGGYLRLAPAAARAGMLLRWCWTAICRWCYGGTENGSARWGSVACMESRRGRS
jgi:hypothetical protein